MLSSDQITVYKVQYPDYPDEENIGEPLKIKDTEKSKLSK